MLNDSQSQTAGREKDPAWAWAVYRPDAGRPWNLRWAGHLYRRAAFGASRKQLEQALADGPERTVGRLLQPTGDAAAYSQRMDQFETLSVDPDSGDSGQLRPWWLRRLLETPYPLLETLTLFWHNHFAISGGRVGNAVLMQRHVRLLRQNALGKFSTLLQAVAHDPATLLALNAKTNPQSQPNDHFARRLLDVFSLGPGQYCEQDVREAARAFTGWTVMHHDARLIDREHDPGVKSVLGERGPFSGDDVVRIILKQAAAPRLIMGKLYRWLISESQPPSAELIGPLAESFARDFDIARLVETMLRSNLFFSPTAYRQRIKSPIEFVVGMARGLEGILPTAPLAHDLSVLGQTLGEPPTIQGWEGGQSWINRFTLLARGNLAQTLVQEEGPYAGKLDPAAIARQGGAVGREQVAPFLLRLFLQDDVAPGVRERLTAAVATANPAEAASLARRLTVAIATLPEFQLA